ncbi:DUF6653 family protein [Pannonibacter phragmitetus]|uniref:Uncharacterized protein n=1 Tax=Pannonibacter phragmitetus TaxID=121719 RepID=A0A0U3PW62_9HYPH|nr:DUF6653 family protein [Pannonibacter phragmitetus]ALV28452.1 hypothetical protein APZ00_16410 [Pannonibacter phragmitetus]
MGAADAQGAVSGHAVKTMENARQLRPQAGNTRIRPAVMPAGQIRWLGMNAKIWQRHASGWSVWTRFATLPVLLLAVWSHSMIGLPGALAATSLVLIWLWLNPRLFPPPRRTDRWHVRATFGERIWLNRMFVPIPAEMSRTALALSLLAGAGFIMALWGAAENMLALTLGGTALTYAGKMAFLHQMTKLYARMKDSHPLYKAWSLTPQNDNSSPSGLFNRKHG